MTLVCPHCGDTQPGIEAGHPCPRKLTPTGKRRWVNYKPQPEGDTAE